MKKLFSRFSILITAIFCLSGCFKPDMNGEASDNKKLLYGYWEVVHVADDDYWYYVDSEGVQSETLPGISIQTYFLMTVTGSTV